MSKKIVFLCGSPHPKGDSNTLVRQAADSATEAGAEVEIVDVTKLDYKTGGCIGCMGCQKSDEFRCVIHDEATDILARLPEADAVVFVTPVYWAGPTAQLKRFTDRMFSLVKINEETGDFRHTFTKTSFALVAPAGGGMDDGLRSTVSVFEFAAKAFGQELITLLAPNVEQTDADELQQKAAAFGKTLAG